MMTETAETKKAVTAAEKQTKREGIIMSTSLTAMQRDELLRSGTFSRFPNCGTWAQAITRKQPGYKRGEAMQYALTAKTGGLRLYVRVAGQWMDASLDDI